MGFILEEQKHGFSAAVKCARAHILSVISWISLFVLYHCTIDFAFIY